MHKILKSHIEWLKQHNIPLNKWIAIEDRVYHGSPGISASGLKDIQKCPALYKFKKDNYEPDSEKPETLIVGSAIHTFILEPEKFKETYIVAPSNDKRKKEWKNFVMNIDERDREKPILRKESMDVMLGVKKSLCTVRDRYGTNIFQNLIHHPETKRERAIYTIDPNRGILLKAKVDINYKGILFDLKSTKNAQHSLFIKDAANLGYDIQAAFYLKVVSLAKKKAKGFGFIGIEKKPPYLSNSILMERRDITLASFLTEKLLDEYTFCVKNQLWYGYNGIDKAKKYEPLMVSVPLPNWHRYSIEEMSGFTI
jgi:hypothetical protein